MKPDDLDKILLSDRQIDPSPSFAQNVMLRVQTEASLGRREPFPWFRFAAIMFIMAIPAIWFFPSVPVLNAMNTMSYSIGEWLLSPGDPALRQALRTVFVSLLGTLILVWFSLRLAGADRASPGRFG